MAVLNWMANDVPCAVEIYYQVDLMPVYPSSPYNGYIADYRRKSEGFPFTIIQNYETGKRTAVLANDENLQKYLSDTRNQIAGRGVTVEHWQDDQWFIAWRPYAPDPAKFAQDPDPTKR